MIGLWRHFRSRLSFCMRDPYSLLALSAFGAMSQVLWPSPWGEGVPVALGEPGAITGSIILLLWLWQGTAIPAACARGWRLSGPVPDTPYGHPLPTLPVGPRARVIGVVLVILPFIIAARLVHFALLDGPGWSYLGHSVLGITALLPFLVLWASPSAGLQLQFVKTLTAVAVLAAAGAAGFLSGTVRFATTTSLMTLGALFLVGRRFRIPSLIRRHWHPIRVLTRPGLAGDRRFRTDRLSLVFKRLGWIIVVLLIVQAGCVVVDQFSSLPRFSVYICSSLVIAELVALVALRPFGSKMLANGLMSVRSARTQDMMKAWSLLPIRREAIVRTIYFHAFITTGCAIGIAFLVIGYYGFLRSGEFSLVDWDGDTVAWLLVPLGSFVPLVAGAVTCSAVGDTPWAGLSLGAIIALPAVNIGGVLMLKSAGQPRWIATVIVIGITLLVTIPPLRHLRLDRRQYDTALQPTP